MGKQYTLKVYPAGMSRTAYRVIQISGKETLDRLCSVIIVVRQIKRCSERHIKYCCLRSIAGESGRLFLVDSARFLLPKHHHAKYMVAHT